LNYSRDRHCRAPAALQEDKTLIERICSALAMLFFSVAAWAQLLGPAVTVNGVPISREKVQSQVDHLVNQRGLGSGGITQPAVYRQITQEVADQLIVQELLWQEAQRRDFIADDELVDARLQEMKNSFDTERAFLFKIKAGGFTEETYSEEIRQQESVRRMITEGISPRISVSDEDVEYFYNNNIEQMRKPVEVRARHILIKPASTAMEDHEAARQEAESILAEIRDGADFVELAKTRSQGPSAPRGGDLGYFGPGQMAAPFERAAFALQPGEISEVAQTQFGYHIIRLEDRRGGETAAMEEVADQIRSYLGQQALQNAVEVLVTTLRDEGDVQIFLNL
jgi:peptidyl-prolyl cis-trans isomerase C